uniref:Protein timeless homolog n=1 Tax=Cacopsylla melanoneura TaxID=428564 RepID=A0A8D8QKJ8_9HEMI
MSCPPEEELLILREIYLTSVLQPKDMDEPPADAEEGQEESDSENEEEYEERALQCENLEQSFQFLDFMKKFLHQSVIKALSHLLAQFDLNSDYTNHCLVKMMHRIAVDCKMPAILFQASVFRTFQKMLQKDEPRFKELTTFAKFIVRKFLSTAAANRHVFMELLFWKTTKDAYEIEEGYNTAPSGSKGGAMGGVWAEHEEDELRRLFMEHEINKVEQDKVDWILENIINKERTRKSVIKKLKELYLITSTKDLKSSVRIKPPTNWSEEEEDQLRTLYQQVKEFHDPMNALRDRMQYKRSKGSVLEKLLELRIIQHKSQLYKKRQRKPQGGKTGQSSGGFDSPDQNSSSSSSSSSDSESDTRSSRHHAAGSLASPHLVATIRSLLDKGSKEIVEWVKEGLEETLEDVDDDETDVPLVPVQESTQQGIEEEDVVSMLTGLGLKSPRENMEVYWRIPGVWNLTALKKRIEFLGKLLNNEDPLEGLPPAHLESSDYSEDDNDDIEHRTPASPSHRQELTRETNHGNESPSEAHTREKKNKKSDKKKRERTKKLEDLRAKSSAPINEDSDSSDFGFLEETRRTNRSGNSGAESSGEDMPNKSRNRIQSDSDQDSDDLGMSTGTASQKKSQGSLKNGGISSGKIDLARDSNDSDDEGRSGNIDLTKDSSDSDEEPTGKSPRRRPKEKSHDSRRQDGAAKADAKKSGKKKRVVVIDSSESENDTNETEADNIGSEHIDNTLSTSGTNSKRRKPVVISSESEDEQEIVNEENSMDIDDAGTNIAHGSATRSGAVINDTRNKKNLTIDSDSDSEPVHIPDVNKPEDDDIDHVESSNSAGEIHEKVKKKAGERKKRVPSSDSDSQSVEIDENTESSAKKFKSSEKKSKSSLKKSKKSTKTHDLSDDAVETDPGKRSKRTSVKRKASALLESDSDDSETKAMKAKANEMLEAAKKTAADIKNKMKAAMYGSDSESDELEDATESPNINKKHEPKEKASTKSAKRSRVLDSDSEEFSDGNGILLKKTMPWKNMTILLPLLMTNQTNKTKILYSIQKWEHLKRLQMVQTLVELQK